MTGQQLIDWIDKNNARGLPVHIRHVGAEKEEEVEEPEIKVSIVYKRSEEEQLKYSRYIMI